MLNEEQFRLEYIKDLQDIQCKDVILSKIIYALSQPLFSFEILFLNYGKNVVITAINLANQQASEEIKFREEKNKMIRKKENYAF